MSHDDSCEKALFTTHTSICLALLSLSLSGGGRGKTPSYHRDRQGDMHEGYVGGQTRKEAGSSVKYTTFWRLKRRGTNTAQPYALPCLALSLSLPSAPQSHRIPSYADLQTSACPLAWLAQQAAFLLSADPPSEHGLAELKFVCGLPQFVLINLHLDHQKSLTISWIQSAEGANVTLVQHSMQQCCWEGRMSMVDNQSTPVHRPYILLGPLIRWWGCKATCTIPPFHCARYMRGVAGGGGTKADWRTDCVQRPLSSLALSLLSSLHSLLPFLPFCCSRRHRQATLTLPLSLIPSFLFFQLSQDRYKLLHCSAPLALNDKMTAKDTRENLNMRKELQVLVKAMFIIHNVLAWDSWSGCSY